LIDISAMCGGRVAVVAERRAVEAVDSYEPALLEHATSAAKKDASLTGNRKCCTEIETDILVDCFIALYRLKYDNEVFRICLAPYSLLQLVLVAGLFRFIGLGLLFMIEFDLQRNGIFRLVCDGGRRLI
jgi:hypothetical protein